MAMLQKERWIFDASRGLKRDTKNPQQSDRDMRSNLEPQNIVIEIEEDEIVVPAAKKKKGAAQNVTQLFQLTKLNSVTP